MAANPPDILLTNFMMLELLMTRQNDIDKAVMRNAKGLRFLVLDELHTYRGRQGADVALLVRRVREALADKLICIGTSATMSTEGPEEERNAAVARVAGRLFGTTITYRNIITETLRRTTPEAQTDVSVAPLLADAIRAGVPMALSFDDMAKHPVSIWVELTLGLSYEGLKPRRARPKTLRQASQLLAKASGLDDETCRAYLQAFLLRAYNVTDASDKSLFAFKLHQFISGGGKVYATLEAPGKRAVTLEGQQFVAGDRTRHLYNVHFCRDCGQEYIPVWDSDGSEGRRFQRRNIDERQHEDEDVKFGFLMPDAEGQWDSTALERFPETWVEERADGEWRIKSAYRKFLPQAVRVGPDGVLSPGGGLKAWFIPGGFRFCLGCGTAHTTSGKDSLRLRGYSALLRAAGIQGRRVIADYAKWAAQDVEVGLSEDELDELALCSQRNGVDSLRRALQDLLDPWMDRRSPRWLIGFRGITGVEKIRTIIGSVVPRSAVGNSLPLLLQSPSRQPRSTAALVGNLAALVLDFAARQKVGGANLNFFIMKQLPVLPPSQYSAADLDFIVPRVLELTYTAADLKSWAVDVGHLGKPFGYEPVRRAQLRAELDAYFARLYRLTRDELRFVLDPSDVEGIDYPTETFRVLKNSEQGAFDEYRTRRLVLESWDRLAAAPR